MGDKQTHIMKFGFKNLVALMLGSAMMGQAAQTSADEIAAIRKLNSGGTSYSLKAAFPRSHRTDGGKKKKSNRKRLSHNAKLKRRRAK